MWAPGIPAASTELRGLTARVPLMQHPAVIADGRLHIVLSIVVGLAGSGCGDMSTPNQMGLPGSKPALLTRRDPEPAGANCPLGGTAVRAGLDRNGNGTLDDTEVERTEYICN